MNLVTNPWLPVINKNNLPKSISLNQLFEQPDEWIDLVLRPHERVSVMRFLICLTQAALDGPVDTDDWDDALGLIPSAVLDYLKNGKGKDCFNLYDAKKPFLQISDLEAGTADGNPPVTKLDSTFATGVNSTLFDHSAISPLAGSSQERLLSNDRLVISLLTFLNFSASGTQSAAKWKGKLITHNSGALDAPCVNQNMLHTFVRKESVIKTIHANLLDKETVDDYFGEKKWGLPIWESMPTKPDDHDALINAKETYLGRLIPLSRFCKLIPNSSEFIYCNGIDYSTKPKKKTDSKQVYTDFKPEPSATVMLGKDDKYYLLRAGNIQPWREIPAIFSKREKNSFGGALCLSNICSTETVDIMVLGQLRDSKNVAKILDLVESNLNISPALLSEANRGIYEKNIGDCEKRASVLFRAIEKYRIVTDDDWKNLVKRKSKGKSSEIDRKKYEIFKNKAICHYWTLLEKQRHLLMQYIDLLGSEFDKEREEAKAKWRRAIRSAVRETYQTLCSQNTPRQVRAYVAGWAILCTKQKII
ncbi:MAG: type I-E CRISPR-associated protein Cse1/CasA [Methylococcales bacterium]|nr:type I-E CRISPR-associated protein Cse1/CasA [Methylococcales bacterium]